MKPSQPSRETVTAGNTGTLTRTGSEPNISQSNCDTRSTLSLENTKESNKRNSDIVTVRTYLCN